MTTYTTKQAEAEMIAEMKRAALAATPQSIDTAQRIEHYDDGSHIECPACGGEGHVEIEADFCNYDGTAIGVQFYGVGNAHGAAEAYLRAAMPANVLALIDRLERAEAALLSASKRAAQSVNTHEVSIGWRVVPSALTASMAEAYRQYFLHTQNIYGAWTKMLEAAPAAPVQSAVALDDERAAFEAWAKQEGLEESLALMIARRAWLARAASPQSTATQTWQPIEKAPKDGTEVLIYLGAPWSKTEKARWCAPWNNWQAGVIPSDPVREEYFGIGASVPTHWMPLPEAPVATFQQKRRGGA